MLRQVHESLKCLPVEAFPLYEQPLFKGRALAHKEPLQEIAPVESGSFSQPCDTGWATPHFAVAVRTASPYKVRECFDIQPGVSSGIELDGLWGNNQEGRRIRALGGIVEGLA
jgi:hypothetical protein